MPHPERCFRPWFVVLALAVSASSFAEDAQEFVLLPIYLRSQPTPGANGSVWMTELVVHNGNEARVSFGPCNVPSERPCPPASYGIEAGETLVDPDVGFTTAGRHGRLIHIPRELADAVSFNLRVFDAAATAIDAGAEIPVIRSGQFRTTPLQLLNLPAGPTNRLTLRVYDPDDLGPAAVVSVSIYTTGGTLLKRLELPLTASGYGRHEGLEFAPSFIELALDVAGDPGERLRVEVAPVTPGLRLWAFVSVTNNATQRVTIVSPM